MKIQTNVDHKTRTVNGETVLVLTNELVKELQNLQRIVIQKRDTTATDIGTCVMGGGICIDVIRPRYRNTERFRFICNPFQGNVGSYRALKPVLEYLNMYYPELNAYYYDGVMD